MVGRKAGFGFGGVSACSAVLAGSSAGVEGSWAVDIGVAGSPVVDGLMVGRNAGFGLRTTVSGLSGSGVTDGVDGSCSD